MTVRLTELGPIYRPNPTQVGICEDLPSSPPRLFQWPRRAVERVNALMWFGWTELEAKREVAATLEGLR